MSSSSDMVIAIFVVLLLVLAGLGAFYTLAYVSLGGTWITHATLDKICRYVAGENMSVSAIENTGQSDGEQRIICSPIKILNETAIDDSTIIIRGD